MSLEKQIEHYEKAFGPDSASRFANARQVACVVQDAELNPAYRAGLTKEDIPTPITPEPLGRPVGSAPFAGEGHLSGVSEIVNNEGRRSSDRDRGDR